MQNRGDLRLLIPMWFLMMAAPTFGQYGDVGRIEDLLKSGEYEKAEILLKKLPESGKILELKGDLAAYRKQWSAAAKVYEDLLKLDPQSAAYNFKYGAVLAMQAREGSQMKAVLQLGKIKEHLLRAAELDPNHIEVRWALVELHLQLPGFLGGGVDKAENYARELEEISTVDGHLAKGHIAESIGDFEAAEYHYKQAISVGQSLHSYQKLGALYLKKKEPLQAFRTKEEAFERHPNNSLRFELGEMAAQNQIRLSKGVGYFLDFISSYSPEDGIPKEWAYFWKSRLHSLLGERDAALKAIQQAVDHKKDFKEGIAEKELLLRGKL